MGPNEVDKLETAVAVLQSQNNDIGRRLGHIEDALDDRLVGAKEFTALAAQVGELRDSMRWAVRIVMGMVITAVVGMAAVSSSSIATVLP